MPNGWPVSCSSLEARRGPLTDKCGEQIGMLRGGEMATGKQANVEASGTQPRTCRYNLLGLVGIFLAVGDTKSDRTAQRAHQPGEVPAPGMRHELFSDTSCHT